MPAPKPHYVIATPSVSQFNRRKPDTLSVLAAAKLNLNLLVSPRRGDGFHELDSLAVRISLYDRIDLRLRRDGQVRLSCLGADCGPDQDNLAVRAAVMLSRHVDAPGVDITLHKQIPPGRGLGGGSSDAAGVLAGLVRLWRTDMDDRPDIAGLAAHLGSDVPFFTGPPAARMTGRGEKLHTIEVHGFTALLILPRVACSTAEVYRCFDDAPEPAVAQLDVRLLREPPSRWRGLLVNQLCPAVERMWPELADLRRTLARCVRLPVSLTGSGSAMFVLCDDLDEAVAAGRNLPKDLPADCVIVQSNPW